MPMRQSMPDPARRPTDPEGLRADEAAVRLVFVEHCGEYAALVRETLERARKGRFEVRPADRLDAAFAHVEAGDYDAVLVDLTRSEARPDCAASIEVASALAHRVPVIVLTGSEDDDKELTPVDRRDPAKAVRDGMARSRLPDAILSAVRRYRRLGCCGAVEPIVLRDPLRGFARAFARLRGAM